MRKTLMLALVAGSLASGGVAVLATQAQAQGAPPAAPVADAPAPGMHPPMDGMRGHMGGHPGGWMGHGSPGGRMGGRMGGMMHRMRAFALIYPTEDRNLSGPDVQKIAEAFLLFNGNHSWKVTEVKEEPNRVTFALATPDGTAIAHFAMDRHNGRPERLS